MSAAKIFKIVASKALAKNALEMGDIHTCKTTHCIAGWACVAIPGGLELEKKIGWNAAGAVLLGVDAAKHFFAKNEKARKYLETAGNLGAKNLGG